MPYFPPAGGGAGDLVGPASSGDNALVRFDSTTGKLVQDSNATLSDTGLLTLTGGIAPGGHSEPTADGLYDLGNVLGNLFRNINLGGGINASGYMHCRVGATSASASLKGAANGVLTLANWDADDFNRLQFGGTTSGFPSIKRSTTVLQARLADDSAYAFYQGKLRLETDAVPTTAADTGVAGEVRWASGFIYFCVATDTWQRVAIATW